MRRRRAPPVSAASAARSQARTLSPSAIYAVQAAEMVIDAIARSDGTRESVLAAFLRARVRDGLLGTFGFDLHGDITESPVKHLGLDAGPPGLGRGQACAAECVGDQPRGCSSGRVLGAVRVVLAAKVAVAAVEELEYGGHVCRPRDVVAHHVGVTCGVGRLGIAALDELGAYRMREAQLRDAPVPVEDTELEVLIADDGGAVRTLLGVHAGPGVELVGDLIDERRCVGHEPIVLVRRRVAIGANRVAAASDRSRARRRLVDRTLGPAVPARYLQMRRAITTELLTGPSSRGHPSVDPALKHSDLLLRPGAIAGHRAVAEAPDNGVAVLGDVVV
jgi:hypothetical protein